MASYRCYSLDKMGSTLGVHNFAAEGDEQACEKANQMLVVGEWHGLELWQAYRKIPCPFKAFG